MDPGAVERVKSALGWRKNVVVFLHPNIGDVVNLTAVFRWMRQLCPESRLVAVTSELAAPIARACPHVSDVWIRPEGILERMLFVFRLREAKFDLSLHCQGQNTMLRLACQAGVPVRIGVYGTKHRSQLDLGVEWQDGEVEQPETVGRLLAALGADTSDRSPEFTVPKACQLRAAELVQQGSLAFMVGASDPAKQWPLDRFFELREGLSEPVVWIGGPNERAMLEPSRPEGDLSGQLSLLETAAVLQRCSVLVTNDSGPMHLAGAVGTPVVALFGPTSCERFRPPGQGHVLIQGTCKCAVRDLDQCQGHCLNSITVEQVREALRSRAQIR
ncbi:MAG: glycosyltransferase family 9 protein [Armatimonadetes bacterium]|nr:glycosyltransferase family 9 protein [Armatimonadota bacterium]